MHAAAPDMKPAAYRAAVLAALEQNGGALAYASDALRNDRAFVREAVKHHGLALRYASAALKGDRAIVASADEQIVMEAAGSSAGSSAASSDALQFASPGLRD